MSQDSFGLTISSLNIPHSCQDNASSVLSSPLSVHSISSSQSSIPTSPPPSQASRIQFSPPQSPSAFRIQIPGDVDFAKQFTDWLEASHNDSEFWHKATTECDKSWLTNEIPNREVMSLMHWYHFSTNGGDPFSSAPLVSRMKKLWMHYNTDGRHEWNEAMARVIFWEMEQRYTNMELNAVCKASPKHFVTVLRSDAELAEWIRYYDIYVRYSQKPDVFRAKVLREWRALFPVSVVDLTDGEMVEAVFTEIQARSDWRHTNGYALRERTHRQGGHHSIKEEVIGQREMRHRERVSERLRARRGRQMF